MTNKEYNDYVMQKMPKSHCVKNTAMAFLFGGAICTLGQVLLNLYKSWGADKLHASTYVSITLVFLGALFTGLKVYDNVAKIAGAGTIVPITGFANSIVSPAMEFKREGIILGMAAKMFQVAGPVIVFGTVASVIYGVIYWAISK